MTKRAAPLQPNFVKVAFNLNGCPSITQKLTYNIFEKRLQENSFHLNKVREVYSWAAYGIMIHLKAPANVQANIQRNVPAQVPAQAHIKRNIQNVPAQAQVNTNIQANVQAQARAQVQVEDLVRDLAAEAAAAAAVAAVIDHTEGIERS